MRDRAAEGRLECGLGVNVDKLLVAADFSKPINHWLGNRDPVRHANFGTDQVRKSLDGSH